MYTQVKIVVAYYGFFDSISKNSNLASSWKDAHLFFLKNVYNNNREHHDIQTVFHTWEEPTEQLTHTLRPFCYSVTSQVVHSDSTITALAKGNGYKPHYYNNLRNRITSMKKATELASSLSPDVIFLTRFDCVITKPINFNTLEYSNVIYAPNWHKIFYDAVVDHYYLASCDDMQRFINVLDSVDTSLFAQDSEYVKWLSNKRGLKSTWLDSHRIVRWAFDKAKLQYEILGYQDKDTCLSRQLGRFGFRP